MLEVVHEVRGQACPEQLLFSIPSAPVAAKPIVTGLKPKKTNRVNAGAPTNDLVFSAYQGTNDRVFPLILSLYVPDGSHVADVTYGRGVFWRGIERARYHLYASDLRTTDLPTGCRGGTDSRSLPYVDGAMDAVVFDPPYMHTPGGTAHNGHQNYEAYYANNVDAQMSRELRDVTAAPGTRETPKYHEAVLDLYYRSGREAWRVLRSGGVFIVKCQDEVCTNRQRLTHVEITVEYQRLGFVVEDLFVVVRSNRPGVSRLKGRQYHARKNHSYFLVYRKPGRNSSCRG